MDQDLRTTSDRERPHALAWIDSHEAIIVRWEDDQARIERVRSEVPDRGNGEGHVRRDPAVRHGGSAAQDTEAARREVYLARFVKAVTLRLPVDADLTVLGPGETHEHLVKALRTADIEHHHARRVVARRSSRKTDRQLIALLREIEGDEARRRTTGEPHPAHAGRAEVVS